MDGDEGRKLSRVAIFTIASPLSAAAAAGGGGGGVNVNGEVEGWEDD